QPGIELRRYVFAGIDQKVSVQLLPVDVIDGYSPEGHIGRPPLYYILSGILVRIEPDLVADRKPGGDVVAHSSLAKHPVYIAGIGSVFGYPIGIIHTGAVIYVGARYRVFKRKLRQVVHGRHKQEAFYHRRITSQAWRHLGRGLFGFYIVHAAIDKKAIVQHSSSSKIHGGSAYFAVGDNAFVVHSG